MKIQTEPIGSIPRPRYLLEGMRAFANHELPQPELDKLFEIALTETITQFEATGSPVITDGEQTKPSFATYPVHGLETLAPDGVVIPFADGHTRQLPKITAGPFRYQTYAGGYVQKARTLTRLPVKQAVISASALSLLYPQEGVDGYSRDQFITDLLNEAEKDIRSCFDNGAYNVQIDFTEARLALKLDPSKGLLQSFIDLNNQVLNRFTAEERKRIGVHTCPGGDHDSTHSADIDYAELLPSLFQLNAGSFYLEYAAEKNKLEVLQIIKGTIKPDQRVFIGVTNVLERRVETAAEIRDLILEAAEFIPVEQLGTTDDCGFSPFADDTSTSREMAFAKIKARVEGTALASAALERSQVIINA
ncbi:5-methyltetrahydropteroyltriglutamate--homocysteine methyltransferase [Niastella koreensis]|uniref:Methionine synthase vitamin-B12 independent n=2 Tax=Niastella koreensis TaxID=354356 RepID=G8TD35_NIAKG|nr:cobalamin-independent methionine synthase II family protein [Niastella koreensis]AEV98267.1 Methionine synthase vitamin-B12 independent [Niastella koreensis GR20-10]OQP53276.1 5-methyltetrahydropteroyltriglutamate--homocysteine methyltransferase [Niastella koreensis]